MAQFPSKRTRRGRLRDPSRIRNPHARPKSSTRAPQPELPPVEERPQEYDSIRIAFQRGEEYSWDNPAVWELTYRSVYHGGHQAQEARYRRVIAATRAKAVETLQRLEYGFSVERILLYHVSPPLRLDQIGEIRRLNEMLAKERRR